MSNDSLVPLTESDLDRVLGWRNHPGVRRYMYSRHEIAPEEHRAWFERCQRDLDTHLLLFLLDGVPCGFVNFTQIRHTPVADWGFYLAPDSPKGAGWRLGKAALDHGFGPLRLHKVCGEALAFNQRSIRFHSRLGFREEGILVDQHYDGQAYHAVHRFVMLANDWSGEIGEEWQ